MVDQTGDADRFPRNVVVSTERPDLRYELAEDVVARQSEGDLSGSIRAASSEPGTREVTSSGPVYRRVPGGEVVVPTGRVLVRFNEGDAVAEHQEELRGVGFVVEQVLPYATHTAWLRAAAGGVAAALHGLDQLSHVPGVVAVEPQMVGAVSRRN